MSRGVVFRIKRTNLLPSLLITLVSTVTFDLSAALSVAFVYRAEGSSDRTSRTATVTDATNKIIRVDWQAADVETVGTYEYQVEVTFSSGVMTFPNDGFNIFEVVETIET